MTYPGDPSLTPDVQQRILNTYQQTLHLASEGKRTEAQLACDFVVQLDPRFGPARVLQQMLLSDTPPEAFRALLGTAPAPAPPAPPPAPPLFDELADLETAAPPAPSHAVAVSGDLVARLSALVDQRRFAEAIALADAERRAVAADPRLRQLIDQAHARLEAEPYLKTFLDGARQALQAGELEEYERLMRKARLLDPTHPGLAELESAKGFYTDPDRALAGRRPGAATPPPSPGSPVAPPLEPAAAPAAAASDFGADLELPDLDFSLPTGEASGGFDLDLAEPAGPAAAEGEGRIAELLREGQAAFDRGEYQGAIDAWSRIFLIDIDHQEAARRIEQARQLKAERERQTEELFHDAVAHFDAGDLAAARGGFERVLSVSPGYVLAQEYLEKIRERETAGPLAPPTPADRRPSGEFAPAAAPAPRPAPPREKLAEEILVPPDPGEARAARRAPVPSVAASAKKRAGGSPRFLAIGGAVLVLVAAAGWFLSTRWSTLFPNTGPVATPAPAVIDPVAKAKQLHAEGKTAMAIPQLRRIPPQDPHYAEAQTLISQWEALVQQADQPKLSPREAENRRHLLEQARRALDAGENVRARSYAEQARAIAPLTGADAELAAAAAERTKGFAEELRLFQQGDFEYLLNSLWRRRETEKGVRDLDCLIVDSYYNLGLLDLQRGDPAAARQKFDEALKIDGGDPAVQRLQRFARAYESRGEDLLYRIFVKYLPTR